MAYRIDQTPEWDALTAHRDESAGSTLRDLFAADPGRGTELVVAGRRPVPGLLQEPAHRARPCSCWSTLAGRGRAARADRRDVRRRAHQHHRGPRRAARRTADAARRETLVVDGQDVVADVHAGARPDGRLRRPGARRRSGPGTPAERDHATSSTSASAAPTSGPAMAYEALRAYSDRTMTLPVRLQHRPDRPSTRRSSASTPARRCSSSCSKTFSHAGDARPTRPRRASWLLPVSVRTRPTTGRGGQALRRRLHPSRAGGRLRHRPGEHVRLLGLGRRPLLLRLGDRAVAHGRHRPGAVRRDARRLPHHRRAPAHHAVRPQPAGAAGPDLGLVQRLLRRAEPGGAALQPVPAPVPGLPAAAVHGEQRQVGHPRRRARCTGRPARSSGASRAPTGSTRSTSCCTRARGWCRRTSSASREPNHDLDAMHDLFLSNLLAQPRRSPSARRPRRSPPRAPRRRSSRTR